MRLRPCQILKNKAAACNVPFTEVNVGKVDFTIKDYRSRLAIELSK